MVEHVSWLWPETNPIHFWASSYVFDKPVDDGGIYFPGLKLLRGQDRQLREMASAGGDVFFRQSEAEDVLKPDAYVVKSESGGTVSVGKSYPFGDIYRALYDLRTGELKKMMVNLSYWFCLSARSAFGVNVPEPVVDETFEQLGAGCSMRMIYDSGKHNLILTELFQNQPVSAIPAVEIKFKGELGSWRGMISKLSIIPAWFMDDETLAMGFEDDGQRVFSVRLMRRIPRHILEEFDGGAESLDRLFTTLEAGAGIGDDH